MSTAESYAHFELEREGWKLRLIVDLTPLPNRCYRCAMDIRPEGGKRWGNIDSKISFEMLEAIQSDETYLGYFFEDMKSKYPK